MALGALDGDGGARAVWGRDEDGGEGAEVDACGGGDGVCGAPPVEGVEAHGVLVFGFFWERSVWVEFGVVVVWLWKEWMFCLQAGRW